MGNSTTDLERILKTAIEVEENGFTTFDKLAEQTQVESGKRMFRQLAKDEIEHREILEKQLKNLTEGAGWQSIHIPKSEIEKLIPAIRDKQKRTKGESGLGEIDALNTALDLERNTAQFFRNKAEDVDVQGAKELFLRLAEWEDSHFELIMAQLDYVKNTGCWFGIPEFRMDGMY